MNPIDRVILRFEQIVVIVGLAIGTIATILEVGARFLFGTTTGTGGELTNNAIIWAALMGAALGAREGIHIGIDELVKRLPAPATKGIVVAGLVISALFTAYLAVVGVQLVLFSQSTGQVTMEMYLPRWPFYIAVPLSMALITYHFLQEAVRRLREPAEEVRASLHQEEVVAYEEAKATDEVKL